MSQFTSHGSAYGGFALEENPLKKREDELWEQFAQTGVMPPIPTLNDSVSIQRAHNILNGEYNQLQKVLDGEALARLGVLSQEEAEIQLNASAWVLRIVNSAKRAYAKKAQMLASFVNFKAMSKNNRIALASGLDKGFSMLKDEANETKKIELAGKFLSRLVTLASDDNRITQLDEFIRLSISVGWTFAKSEKYDMLCKVVSLLPEPDYSTSEYFRKNIESLRDKVRYVAERPLREWFNDTKAAIEQDVPQENCVQPLLAKLLNIIGIGGWYDGPVRTKDGNEFESRHLAMMRVCQLVKKFKNGIPPACANLLLEIFQKDGLDNLSSKFFERRDKALKNGEQLPQRAKPYWPSLVEEMVKLMVSSCKVCYGRKVTSEEVRTSPNLNWAIDFADAVYKHFVDDDWADFRIGKLLIWSGDLERAKVRLLPVIRKKQSEYWAWDLLGDIFPEKRRACVARALLCEADEIYTKGLKTEAQKLGLDITDKTFLSKESGETFDLLLSGIKPVNGVLMEKFKTSEGKDRMSFSDGTGIESMPLSPKAARLAKNTAEGTPVILYREPTDERQIVAVKERKTGKMWDVLPVEKAVFIEGFKDKNGKCISACATKGIRFLFFRELRGLLPGTPLMVRFSDHIRKDKDPECVWAEKDTAPERAPWDMMKAIPAVFIESFTNDKGEVKVFAREGTQYKFYGEMGNMIAGTPVDIMVMDEADPGRIYRASPFNSIRKTGTFMPQKVDGKCYAVVKSNATGRFLWDALYKTTAVYCGKSKSGTSLTFSSGRLKINVPKNKFEVLSDVKMGDTFEIRYKVREKNGEKIYDALDCRVSTERLDLTMHFSGPIRFATGTPVAGYVDLYADDDDAYYDDYDDEYVQERHSYGSVFIATDFIENLHLKNGDEVSGTAVRLPSKIHVSRRGKRYTNERYQAITVVRSESAQQYDDASSISNDTTLIRDTRW